MFYLLTYGMATIGAFAILTLVRRGDGEAAQVSDWAGLAKRSPVLAASMSLFLLSFAGIPLTAGFIGKLSVFTAAMDAGFGWLVVLAMVATAITAFFYLRIVVVMYFSEPAGAATSGGGAGRPAGVDERRRRRTDGDDGRRRRGPVHRGARRPHRARRRAGRAHDARARAVPRPGAGHGSPFRFRCCRDRNVPSDLRRR